MYVFPCILHTFDYHSFSKRYGIGKCCVHKRALLCTVPGIMCCMLLGLLQFMLCATRTASSGLAMCLVVCMILNEMWFEFLFVVCLHGLLYTLYEINSYSGIQILNPIPF